MLCVVVCNVMLCACVRSFGSTRKSGVFLSEERKMGMTMVLLYACAQRPSCQCCAITYSLCSYEVLVIRRDDVDILVTLC